MKSRILNDFNDFLASKFTKPSGAAASYLRAVENVLEFLNISSDEAALESLVKLDEFIYAPKSVERFGTLFRGFHIAPSYIEKGWVSAGLKQFKLYLEVKQNQIAIGDDLRGIISVMGETELEQIINFSDDASIRAVTMEFRKRILDRSIINSLKSFYNHRCQICEKHFESYGAKISEGHHIDYFSVSCNNNSDNIIILCPDHHRLLHYTKPIFDRAKLDFTYSTGLIEKIKLTDHFIS